MGSIKRPPIYRIPLVQTIVLLVTASVAVFFDTTVAYSLALGGLVHLLPNTYFAVQAFRYQGARAMPLALAAMARGEAGKFVLTLCGFALVFSLVEPLNVPALFGAYVLMLVISVALAAHMAMTWKAR